MRCVTAQNPSPMTLAGTNTYVVAAPDSDAAVVVDPVTNKSYVANYNGTT